MAFYSCPHIYINGRICGKTATGKKVVPFIGKCNYAFLAESTAPTASNTVCVHKMQQNIVIKQIIGK